MYPNYLFFFKEEKWGSPGAFQEIFEYLYLNEPSSTYKNNKILKEVEGIFPDLDEFEGFTASYAFDACAALHEAILFSGNNIIEHAINCSTSAMNTVDMFVQEYLDLNPNIPGLDSIINSHPFMKNEISTQLTILTQLEKFPVITQDVVDYVRLESINNIVNLNLLKE